MKMVDKTRKEALDLINQLDKKLINHQISKSDYRKKLNKIIDRYLIKS